VPASLKSFEKLLTEKNINKFVCKSHVQPTNKPQHLNFRKGGRSSLFKILTRPTPLCVPLCFVPYALSIAQFLCDNLDFCRFLRRDAMLARCMVRLGVCRSVCLSHAGTKGLKISSRIERHTVDMGLLDF